MPFSELDRQNREIDQARTLYQVVLDAFPNNKRAQQALASLEKPKPILSDAINPSQEELNALTTLYKRGQLTEVADQVRALVVKFPSSFALGIYGERPIRGSEIT